MTELIITLIVCAMLFVIGVLIKYFKAYDLIAGYNTAPREVKEQIDAKALGDFTGRQLMIAAFTPLLGYGLVSIPALDNCLKGFHSTSGLRPEAGRVGMGDGSGNRPVTPYNYLYCYKDTEIHPVTF